jgi:hypothetical protein
MLLRWKIAQWFELQWWKRYLSGKSKEEYIAWKTNYWLQLMRTLELEKQLKLQYYYRFWLRTIRTSISQSTVAKAINGCRSFVG